MQSKKSSDYFTNLINKTTIKPIATNTKPRKLHNPELIITYSNVETSALPVAKFKLRDASDTKINPIMNVNIPKPSIIFFLSISSFSKLYNHMKIINIFGGYY
jgi:hypothetical protein